MYVGQRVECIKDDWPAIVCRNAKSLPKKGEFCIIEGFGLRDYLKFEGFDGTIHPEYGQVTLQFRSDYFKEVENA